MTEDKQDDFRLTHHARLGAVRWDRAAELWYAAVDASLIRDQEIGVSAAPDIGIAFDRAADFLDWLPANLTQFKIVAAREAFNYDLIWNDDLEESELASRLTVQSVSIRGGRVEVWLDTGGATTDHLLLAKLDERHKIVDMEL